MTVTSPSRPSAAASVTETPRRSWFRRGRTALLWALVLAVGVTLLTLITLQQDAPRRPLHPESTAVTGSKAVVEVLGQEGVEVEGAMSFPDLDRATIDASTTVLVVTGANLSPQTLTDVRHTVADAGRLVVVTPSQVDLDALRIFVTAQPGSDAERKADCSVAGIDEDDTMSGGAVRYVVDPDDGRPTPCFPDIPPDANGEGDAPPGSAAYLVHLEATPDAPETVILGAPAILMNGRVLEQDNAALALRLLGSEERLVWYLPSPIDAVGTGEAEADEGADGIPDWFVPLMFVLALGTVVLALWRGRRLGRLVTEPLPVVVPASETTRSRAQLYRSAKDRERATAILRDATRRRLTAYLGLGRGTTTDELVDAVARATGRTRGEVTDTLVGTPPRDDATMVTIAEQLAELEERVRGT